MCRSLNTALTKRTQASDLYCKKASLFCSTFENNMLIMCGRKRSGAAGRGSYTSSSDTHHLPTGHNNGDWGIHKSKISSKRKRDTHNNFGDGGIHIPYIKHKHTFKQNWDPHIKHTYLKTENNTQRDKSIYQAHSYTQTTTIFTTLYIPKHNHNGPKI